MAAKKASSRKKVTARTSRKATSRKASAKKTPARKKAPAKASRRPAAAKKASKKKPAGSKAVSRKKAAAKGTAKKATSKKKTSVKKTAASKKKPSAKKSSAKQTTARKAGTGQAKSTSKKGTALKTKKVSTRKTAAKASTTRRSAGRSSAAASSRARQNAASNNLIHGIAPYEPSSGEMYMNDAQLEHFRLILLAWKRELMEEVDRTVHHMQDEASNFPDPNDRATQESEFGLELRTRDRERKLLKKIDSALERIDNGSYGYCEETGEEIGLKRLEARPVATLCVEAQERRELAERQYRDRDDQYR